MTQCVCTYVAFSAVIVARVFEAGLREHMACSKMPLLAVHDKGCQCWQTLYTTGICTIAFIKSIQCRRGSNHLSVHCVASSSVLCLSTYLRTCTPLATLCLWGSVYTSTIRVVPHSCCLLCTLTTMRSVPHGCCLLNFHYEQCPL